MICLTGHKSISIPVLILTASTIVSPIVPGLHSHQSSEPANLPTQEPTVLLILLIRNKQAYLPYVLSRISSLDYPKHRLSLFIRCDHNSDRSAQVLNAWLRAHQHSYHRVNVSDVSASTDNEAESGLWPDETGVSHLSPMRYRHVISVKESALQYARYIWTDYAWFLDGDVVLFGDDVLQYLMSKRLPIVGPMLTSRTAFANFWAAMGDDFYYQRSPRYFELLQRKHVGCHGIPMLHSCVLVDMRSQASRRLTFVRDLLPTPEGPEDDLITFALSARQSGAGMHVCNERHDGVVPVPLETDEGFAKERWNLEYTLLEALVENVNLTVDRSVAHYLPLDSPFLPDISVQTLSDRIQAPDTPATLPHSPALPVRVSLLGIDRVYVINLRRRPDRLRRMLASLHVLGVPAASSHLMPAVDGRRLTSDRLRRLGVRPLAHYEDPFWQRPMTMGEIGCFVSHHRVWRHLVRSGETSALVLEDDVRFGAFFVQQLRRVMRELQRLSLDWDLVYLGRKIMSSDELLVRGSRLLSRPHYTYWTLAYIISSHGAAKLLAEKPLTKLVPVDEYLPIMFDRHPNSSWSRHFHERSLLAFSSVPLLVQPMRYSSDPGYVSDTESSPLMSQPTTESSRL